MRRLTTTLCLTFFVLMGSTTGCQRPGNGGYTELKLLAEKGDADAQYKFGKMHAAGLLGGAGFRKPGDGVRISNKIAAKWYTLAAKQGNARAQNDLGMFYQYGEGIPQNKKTAVKWYRLSADQGNAEAQTRLGLMYEMGAGIPQNDEEAVKWYTLAAEQGNAVAQTSLGFKYANGQGIPQNDKTALKWYRLAVKQGHASAQIEVEILQKKTVEIAEKKCAELGFTKGTEKYGDCVMKLLN